MKLQTSKTDRFQLLIQLALLFLCIFPLNAPAQTESGSDSPSTASAKEKGSATHEPAGGDSQTLHILGRVMSLEGQAVGAAKVRLEFAKGRGSAKQTETDISGHFAGDLLLRSEKHQEVRVRVLVSKPGFEDGRAEATVAAGNTAEINVTILAVNEDPFQISREDLIQRLTPRLKTARDDLSDAARQKYRELAAAVFENGDAAQAASDLEHLAETQPGCVDCATVTSLAMLELGDWSAATRWASQAAKTNKKSDHPRPEPLLLSGVMDSWRHEPNKAVTSFDEALKLQADDPIALQEFGRMQLQLNNDHAADQVLAKAVQAGAPLDVHLLRASALMGANEIAKARIEMNLYVAGRDVKTLPLSSRMVYNRLRAREEVASYGKVKTLFDDPLDKIVKAVPELKGIQPTESQAELPVILKKVGESVAEFFTSFPDTISTEHVAQAMLKGDNKPARESGQTFKYLLLTKPEGRGLGLEEYRTDVTGARAEVTGTDKGFMLTSGFASISMHFHPAYQSGSDFRLLGTQELDGHKTVVVGFAQNPARAQMYGTFYALGVSRSILVQGIAWIDPSSGEILRMRTELLKPLTDVQLTEQTTEIDYRPVTFKTSTRKFWLPREVIVNVTWRGRKLRNDHAYSEFNLFNVRTHESSKAKVLDSGSAE